MSQDWNHWHHIADTYHSLVGSPADLLRTELLYPALLCQMGEIENRSILDIGCGNGYFAHLLAEKGGKVQAFDNPGMIKTAQAHFPDPYIQYQIHDASLPFPHENESFDVIMATMVLMDISDIGTLLSESSRVLKKPGKAYFSILHPCFTPPVGRFRRGLWGRLNKAWAYFHLNHYFDPARITTKHLFGNKGPTTTYYHRTLAEYSDLFAQTGWRINRMIEPRPSSEFLQQHPQFYHAAKIAIFIIFELSASRHPDPTILIKTNGVLERDLRQQ